MKFQTFSIVAGSPACNAHCPFCISRMTGRQFDCSKINWLNFDKACRLAQINNITNVLITGKGEPTLYPDQITDYLRHLQKHNFPVIELQTNAILFAENPEKYDKYLKEWVELGLTFINISVVDYRISKNKEIYQAGRKEYPDLKNLISRLHSFGFSVRFCCTMIKGGIDSVSRVKKMIAASRSWSAEQLTLRLVSAPARSQDTGVKNWTLRHSLSSQKIKDIGDFLDSSARRLAAFDYGAVIYDYEGQNVCYTNALTINPQAEDVRQIIFFPDGHLRYDWQYRGAILF